MKIFITGISGLLGLNAAFQAKDFCAVSGCYLSHPIYVEGIRALQIDVTSYRELKVILKSTQADVILHTAGLTNVDVCEENPDLAYQLNVRGTENVARLARSLGARLVHISTDHLFDGTQRFSKEETQPDPLNVYSRTKWDAEKIVQRYSPQALVVRTNFYGWGTPYKKSFSDWILDGLRNQRELNMFSDVFFTPILVNELIDVIFTLLKAGAEGVYNIAGRERVSKHSFGVRLAEVFNYSPVRIRPIIVDERGLRARRPKDMSLNCEKTAREIGYQMPGVSDGLWRLKSFYEQGLHDALHDAFQGDNGVKQQFSKSSHQVRS